MKAKQFSNLALAGLATIALGTIGSGIAIGQSSLDVATVRNTALSKHNSYRTTHHSANLTLASSRHKVRQRLTAEYLMLFMLFVIMLRLVTSLGNFPRMFYSLNH